MRHLIHYVKFELWAALFYGSFHCSPNSSVDWKLRFSNVGVTPYLHFPPNLHKDRKLGYLNVALGWTFQFFPIDERYKKLEFSRILRDNLVDQSMLFTHLYLTQGEKIRNLVCISCMQIIFWRRIHNFSVCRQQIHKRKCPMVRWTAKYVSFFIGETIK